MSQKVAEAEEALYHDPTDPLVNWDVADIEQVLEAAGYKSVSVVPLLQEAPRQHSESHLTRWFGTQDEPGRYALQLKQFGLTKTELNRVERLYRGSFLNRPVPWLTTYLLIRSS